MLTMQRPTRLSRTVLAAVAVLASLGRPASLAAQTFAQLDLGGRLDVGGEAERYARNLQLVGRLPLTPWSIQPFSPTQNDLLRPFGEHPWAERFIRDDRRGFSFSLLRPSARLIENTAFPFQLGPGPTWAGRGVTGDIQLGFAARWGAISAQVAPLAFVAQNLDFPLVPTGYPGKFQYSDARFPEVIDQPQRFGDQAYSRISPGTSSLVFDWGGVLAGAGSAPQKWGPQREYPLALGPNAGGFPMIFLGTSKPIDLWLVRLHARLLYGKLEQSDFAPIGDGDRRRLAEGLVLVAQPRWLDGLEVGSSRFLHRPWADRSASALRRPFSGLINSNNEANISEENQLASVFARWVVPAARLEVFGEFYKEDYPGGFHRETGSLVEEPDDLATFALGVAHIARADRDGMRIFRAELVNSELGHQQRLERGFTVPIAPYTHFSELQGHTVYGRLLGSPEAYGGSGWTIAMDDYTKAGRRTLSFERRLNLDWRRNAANGASAPDVAYSLRADVVRFIGKRDVGFTIIPTWDLNRNLESHNDVFNLTASLSWRGW